MFQYSMIQWVILFNFLSLERYGGNFKYVTLQHIQMTNIPGFPLGTKCVQMMYKSIKWPPKIKAGGHFPLIIHDYKIVF